MMALSDEDIKRLDDRYVSRSECESRTDKTQNDIAQMSTDIAKICQTLNSIRKLGWIFATAAVGAVVTYISSVASCVR